MTIKVDDEYLERQTEMVLEAEQSEARIAYRIHCNRRFLEILAEGGARVVLIETVRSWLDDIAKAA